MGGWGGDQCVVGVVLRCGSSECTVAWFGLVLIWICVPDATLLACVLMAGFKGVDTRWGFVHGKDQLLYISNVGHVHPVLKRATVSPFHSDREYHPLSSLIPCPDQESYTVCGHMSTDRHHVP